MSHVHANKAESAQDSHNTKSNSGSTHFVDTRASAIGQQAMQLMMQNRPQANAQLSMQNYVHSSPAVQKKSIQCVESEEISTEVETTQFADHLSTAPASADTPSEKPNKTGLPDNLKSGIESLSGMSMDHVKVHFNSDRPAQLNAHAYAQGSEIHVAPGQEQHLPHEAWHVVQQAQGRVKPTLQMKGDVPVNDDVNLEFEADVMGAKALQSISSPAFNSSQPIASGTSVAQCETRVENEISTLPYDVESNGDQEEQTVGTKMEAILDPTEPIKGSAPGNGADYLLYDRLNQEYNPGFVKGHLLNANLGGIGLPYNLYPLTKEANSTHSNQVEIPVKTALLNLIKLSNNDWKDDDDDVDQSRAVKYTVEAKWEEGDDDFIEDPTSYLTCSASVVDDNEDHLFHIIEGISIKSEDEGENDSTNQKLTDAGFGSEGSGRRSGGQIITLPGTIDGTGDYTGPANLSNDDKTQTQRVHATVSLAP